MFTTMMILSDEVCVNKNSIYYKTSWSQFNIIWYLSLYY